MTNLGLRRQSFRQPHLWVVWGLILLATFLRLWNFTDTLQFLGDQGRDAMVVAKIFREGDIVLLGPVTSTGNMYLGPLYYYFMVPFLWLTYPNPIGPAYAVAGLAILTTVLMYFLGKELVGRRAAILATALFSVSSTVVTFSRFSWNPNPAPLFGLLLLWCLYQTERGKYRYWWGVSACVAVLIQLHYVALLAGAISLVFWLRQAREVWPHHPASAQWRSWLLGTLGGGLIFLLSLTPLVVFDLRYNWLNVRSLQQFLLTSQEATAGLPMSARLRQVALETHGRSLHLLFEISIGKHRLLNTILLVLVIALFSWLLRQRKHPHYLGHRLLAVSAVVTVIGLAFYRSSVFDHYIAFFFPITFLILAVALTQLSRWRWGWGLVGFVLLAYTGYNFAQLPLRDLGWTVRDMERTAATITERVQPGEKYNIVLLSETKDVYGMNYRYFLSTSDLPPLPLDRFGEVETLFIIDEQQIVPDVTSLPIYEIVVFPQRRPSEVYQVPGGPKVTVLRKSE